MKNSFSENFSVHGRGIGKGSKPFIIAEVAQAHDGSLGAAHAFIDLAADCGADAIKFQTHIAAAESTIDEPFRVRFSDQDETRYDYWKRMEFTENQWKGLYNHAIEKNIIFMSSPFSPEAISMLDNLGMPLWKVASGEVLNLQLLELMAGTGKPILLSSGMSSFANLDVAIKYLEKLGVRELGIFQCTTKYPTPLAEVGLNVVTEVKERYGVPTGLSDHSADIFPSIAAMTLGAAMIEVHIALHKNQFGPDTRASLTPDQLREVCRARDGIYEMLTNPVDKDAMSLEMTDLAGLFGRSLSLVRDTEAGTVLTKDIITLKKPGGGIRPEDQNFYIGRRLRIDVPANRLLRESDFE